MTIEWTTDKEGHRSRANVGGVLLLQVRPIVRDTITYSAQVEGRNGGSLLAYRCGFSSLDAAQTAAILDAREALNKALALLPPVAPAQTGVEWTCEWCEPSDVVEHDPESCQVRTCSTHGRVWFWPK